MTVQTDCSAALGGVPVAHQPQSDVNRENRHLGLQALRQAHSPH